MNDKELREMMQNNWAAQMDMLGYDRDGLPKTNSWDERDTEKVPEKYDTPRSGMGYEYYDWRCPTCKKFLAWEPDIDGIPRRCQNCGQLLVKPGRK